MSLSCADPTPSCGRSLLELYPSAKASTLGKGYSHASQLHWNTLMLSKNSTQQSFGEVAEPAAGKPVSSHFDPSGIQLVVAAADLAQQQSSL